MLARLSGASRKRRDKLHRMCGRYALKTQAVELAELFGPFAAARQGGSQWGPIFARYNIAPTQSVPVIRMESAASGRRELALLRWGLVPSWADDERIGSRMINARSETAHEKPAFRAAMKSRRCLVPASGFYEWESRGRTKRPHLIRLRDEPLFAMAGLWETWRSTRDQPLESFTILTTSANELLRELHERMPVILPPEAHERWLTGDDVHDLLRPFPAQGMSLRPVTHRLNSPRVDEASLWDPPGAESLF